MVGLLVQEDELISCLRHASTSLVYLYIKQLNGRSFILDVLVTAPTGKSGDKALYPRLEWVKFEGLIRCSNKLLGCIESHFPSIQTVEIVHLDG
jgi:hypothetical protein